MNQKKQKGLNIKEVIKKETPIDAVIVAIVILFLIIIGSVIISRYNIQQVLPFFLFLLFVMFLLVKRLINYIKIRKSFEKEWLDHDSLNEDGEFKDKTFRKLYDWSNTLLVYVNNEEIFAFFLNKGQISGTKLSECELSIKDKLYGMETEFDIYALNFADRNKRQVEVIFEGYVINKKELQFLMDKCKKLY